MVLLAFLAGLALVLVGLAVCIVRGFRLWRQVKTTGRALSGEVSQFEVRSARTERLLAAAESSSKDLQAAVDRLHISRAQLGVLTGELERARARTRWLRAFLPV